MGGGGNSDPKKQTAPQDCISLNTLVPICHIAGRGFTVQKNASIMAKITSTLLMQEMKQLEVIK